MDSPAPAETEPVPFRAGCGIAYGSPMSTPKTNGEQSSRKAEAKRYRSQLREASAPYKAEIEKELIPAAKRYHAELKKAAEAAFSDSEDSRTESDEGTGSGPGAE